MFRNKVLLNFVYLDTQLYFLTYQADHGILAEVHFISRMGNKEEWISSCTYLTGRPAKPKCTCYPFRNYLAGRNYFFPFHERI